MSKWAQDHDREIQRPKIVETQEHQTNIWGACMGQKQALFMWVTILQPFLWDPCQWNQDLCLILSEEWMVGVRERWVEEKYEREGELQLVYKINKKTKQKKKKLPNLINYMSAI